MGEEMMVMIRNNPHNYSSWKLYDNPFYYSHSHQQHHHHQHQHQQQHYQHHHHHHSLNNPPPPSARKLAACLWDLTYIRSIMDSELDMARAKIHELKAELDFQRKSRKKVEALNKKLCKQILEERKRREAVEDVCEKLAKEIASEKMEMDKVKKDIVEERRMLRVAEVLREERVHMKLTEAKILFEEKLSELEFSKMATPPSSSDKLLELEESKVTTSRCTNKDSNTTTTMSSSLENSITVSSSSNNHLLGFVGSNLMNKRRASPEAENPHIKRGIKGFVEFPRVVRAISSRGRQLGSKVECQKAQLRLLLRQKSPFRTDNLIMG